ncbi:hypothetical protein NQZ68_014047 [Dissostichus eleginoides]|nr:hypothetical protein NQZ68_014047 [Dissostichus eleginoides]
MPSPSSHLAPDPPHLSPLDVPRDPVGKTERPKSPQKAELPNQDLTSQGRRGSSRAKKEGGRSTHKGPRVPQTTEGEGSGEPKPSRSTRGRSKERNLQRESTESPQLPHTNGTSRGDVERYGGVQQGESERSLGESRPSLPQKSSSAAGRKATVSPGPWKIPGSDKLPSTLRTGTSTLSRIHPPGPSSLPAPHQPPSTPSQSPETKPRGVQEKVCLFLTRANGTKSDSGDEIYSSTELCLKGETQSVTAVSSRTLRGRSSQDSDRGAECLRLRQTNRLKKHRVRGAREEQKKQLSCRGRAGGWAAWCLLEASGVLRGGGGINPELKSCLHLNNSEQPEHCCAPPEETLEQEHNLLLVYQMARIVQINLSTCCGPRQAGSPEPWSYPSSQSPGGSVGGGRESAATLSLFDSRRRKEPPAPTHVYEVSWYAAAGASFCGFVGFVIGAVGEGISTPGLETSPSTYRWCELSRGLARGCAAASNSRMAGGSARAAVSVQQLQAR